MKYFLFILTLGFLLNSCSSSRALVFSENMTPAAPDYSDTKNWAALPDRMDQADRTPGVGYPDNQENARVDVFYVHPTTFTKKRKKNQWNATLTDIKTNKKTDDTAILYQATSMNGAGKIYAPRYRQAHLNSYYTHDSISAAKAFEIAYSDVKSAFLYFLENYSRGRPFIIAAHSQGTQHAAELIKTLIDGKDLQERLVVAYLIGMPVEKNYFESVRICDSEEAFNCFCTWRSYRRGYIPPYHKDGDNIAITNPLSWRTDTEKVSRNKNEGAVLKKFNKVRPGVVDAEIHNGLLWMDHPKFPFSFLLMTKNYHIGDYNLFYVNIRNNAILRTKSYLAKNFRNSR